MVYVKWAFWGTVWLIVGAFFHYTLPQHDIVRIVNTYEERQELGDWTRIFWSTPDDQSTALINRDVQFIQAVTPEGKAKVYRNEDTGWHWPPYFKFDTANLYTEANDAKSTKDNPEWYSVTHYGWRNEYWSVFPNAVGLKRVDGPDATIIPWLNIIILTLFFALIWAIWVRWRRFRAKRIDPMLEGIEDSWDDSMDTLAEKRGRVRRWLDSWKSKK
ncbi:Protein of unknown function [Thalassovita litoralis]|jgi:hypothetical protein|uniref:DUF1523 domain-containing protein n=1 Tax=Thalassovita litoralis TaxID=1010611 RepID=A0A521DSQ0_9RHOB|nr:DUF1523 family protein [Thalassovita litoralis]SMO74736.1 Protein of unknown function [Thalassovita litoralis]